VKFHTGTVWAALGALLVLAYLGLRLASKSFGYEFELLDMPILWFVAIYTSLVAVFTLTLLYLIPATPAKSTNLVFLLVLSVGLMARITQFGAEPVLEDDYQRYLWDGAVTSAGLSPYTHAPAAILDSTVTDPEFVALKVLAGQVLERVNNPELRTVYLPVAQLGFALAHKIKPFSLDAWRLVLLLAELASLVAIIGILRSLGRSILWVSLYWWHPLVIKEVANSAHMEPLLMAPVLIGAYLAMRHKPVLSAGVFALAAAVKIWPAGLIVVLIAQVWRKPYRLVAMTVVFTLIMAVSIWPIVQSGLDQSSGFVAFARDWSASSAAFLMANYLVGLLPTIGSDPTIAPVATRLLLGAAMVVSIAALWVKSAHRNDTVLLRIFFIVAALYIFSPSQTPWYFLWVAPFLCFFPVRGLCLAGITISLHYLFFHMAPRGFADAYRQGVVWLIWVPVWVVLVYDLVKQPSQTTKGPGTENVG
jgi:alpha-1,6-mannosyltransferase